MLDDLIAVCGPSRAKCPAYIATHTNNLVELQRMADEWTKARAVTYGQRCHVGWLPRPER